MNVYDEEDQPFFVGHVHLPVLIGPELACVIVEKQPDPLGRFAGKGPGSPR